jgi:hypothetical protein
VAWPLLYEQALLVERTYDLPARKWVAGLRRGDLLGETEFSL